ncbi:MAG: IclR family transcriptional regulator [Burkholderiales bacterium]|nr:IclR family transcriptional regulator [Burkholderiales bacterium]MDE2455430.1 IclR family transcriptional regulator [Burkholderiales bacterium]
MDSTLAKGLAVLEWLVRQPRASRVSEVAEAFGLARSNAHRTLQTLVECGWAQQEEAGGAYCPALKLFELGVLVESGLDLKAALHPLLERLANATGETIHLAVLDGAEILYLDKFDSPLPVAAYSRIGGRAPAYCVASGKALLAAAEPDEAALRRRLGKLVAHTPQTLVRFDALLSELERTRERGWGENREEWRTGVCGLGAPVFNARGEAVAAVGMSVPAIRFGRAAARAWAEQMMACAAEASVALGWAAAPAAPRPQRDRAPGTESTR